MDMSWLYGRGYGGQFQVEGVDGTKCVFKEVDELVKVLVVLESFL